MRRWQLAQYLETARQTEPFDASLFEPQPSYLLGDEEIEFDAEEVEDLRKEDIRQCTRDLLLVERAREWLLEEEAMNHENPRRSQDRPGSAKTGVSGLWRATDRNPCEAPVLPLPHNLRDML